MEPDPLLNALEECLRKHPLTAGPWSGICYRSVSLEFGRTGPLIDGRGVWEHPGRWNPAKVFRGVYLSLSVQGSVEEVFRTAAHYGFDAEDLRPRVVAALRVSLRRVVDLAKETEMLRLVGGMGELLRADWRQRDGHSRLTPSQMLGALAFAAGHEAILVPSATGAGKHNLLIFNRNLGPESSIQIIKGRELDHWLRRRHE